MNNAISLEQYNELGDLFFILQEINLRTVALDLSQASRVKNGIESGGMGEEVVIDEAYNERLVIEFLLLLDDLRQKNGGLTLPDYPTGTETLSPREMAQIEAWRAQERASDLKGEDRRRLRENLKKMFDTAIHSVNEKGDIELRRVFQEAWLSLDATLEGDIKLRDSIRGGRKERD